MTNVTKDQRRRRDMFSQNDQLSLFLRRLRTQLRRFHLDLGVGRCSHLSSAELLFSFSSEEQGQQSAPIAAEKGTGTWERPTGRQRGGVAHPATGWPAVQSGNTYDRSDNENGNHLEWTRRKLG
jgi:hypothetical protein